MAHLIAFVGDIHAILSSFGISERDENPLLGVVGEGGGDVTPDLSNATRLTFQRLELIFPLVLLILFRIVSQVWIHVIFMTLLFISVYYLDKMFKHQVALKDSQNRRKLMVICVSSLVGIVIVHLATTSSLLLSPTLYRRALLLPLSPQEEGEGISLYSLIWMALVTDMSAALLSILLKSLAALHILPTLQFLDPLFLTLALFFHRILTPPSPPNEDAEEEKKGDEEEEFVDVEAQNNHHQYENEEEEEETTPFLSNNTPSRRMPPPPPPISSPLSPSSVFQPTSRWARISSHSRRRKFFAVMECLFILCFYI